MRKILLCSTLLILLAIPVLAQDDSVQQSQSFLTLVGSAITWATFAVFVSQITSIALVWMLGVPPRKLAHEIEEVQNPAVGACFFIISLTASLFVALMTTDGFSPDPSFAEGAVWIIGGLILGFIYTFILFMIAHRLMGRQPNENLFGYIKREIVLEQNAALAFFLGGLSVTPFISIVFQLL